MSYRIRLVADPGILVCELFDTVSIQDLRECSECARTHPGELTRKHHLAVYRDGAQIDFSTNEMAIFAASASRLRYDAKRIIVAPDDLSFGMSRMLELMRHELGDAIVVVKTLNDAAELLEVSINYLQQVLNGDAGELLASGGHAPGREGSLSAS